MRVCVNIDTGKIIEAQSGGSGAGDLDVLRQNAAAAGFNNVDVVYATDADFQAMLLSQPLSIDEQVAAKIAELTATCKAACVAGYTSDILGTLHFYPTEMPEDQVNLLGCHADAIEHEADPAWTQEITCVPDGAATSDRVAHTAAQTLAITVPVKQMIAANRLKYNTKKHYILAIDPASPTAEADIAAVTWDSVE